MSEISKALALEETFEYEGRSYKLAAMSFEVVGLWEAYLKRRADLDLFASKAYLPPDEYAYRVSQVSQDKAAGLYGFMSQVSLNAQLTWDGKIEFTGLRLAEAPANGMDVDAARSFARKLQEEAVEAWDMVQRKLREMDADPNRQAPPMTETAGPSSSSPSAPGSSASPGTSDPGKSAG